MTTPFTVEPFAVDESGTEGTVGLALAGDLDLAGVPKVNDALARCLRDPACGTVILDLAGVTFIDSTGLGELVASKRQAADADKVLKIVGANGRTARIIELTGLTDHLLEP